MGVMTDDRFDERLRQAAQDYHRPPATPREELWHRIAAARAARKRHVIVVRPTLRWGVGIAAVLALGVAIGRWSARRGESPSSPTVIAGTDQASTLAYRVAAAQYLTRTEALLTGFHAEARSPSVPAVQFSRQARDLLATTRLMLDSPAARDARLKGLLEDLELVLAQIAQLPAGVAAIGKTYSRSTRDWTNAACCCGCGRRTPPVPAPCARKEHCDAGDVPDGSGRRWNAATYCATHGRTRVGARAGGAPGIGRARRPRCARCPERARCARRGGPLGQRPAPR